MKKQEIIKSIEINIGNATVKVSMKQAKELYQALTELLGQQPSLTVTPYIYPWWTGQTYTTDSAPLDTTITIQ